MAERRPPPPAGYSMDEPDAPPDLASALEKAKLRFPGLNPTVRTGWPGDLGLTLGQNIWVNMPAHKSQQDLYETLVHELTHADQYRRQGLLRTFGRNLVSKDQEKEAERNARPPFVGLLPDVHPR